MPKPVYLCGARAEPFGPEFELEGGRLRDVAQAPGPTAFAQAASRQAAGQDEARSAELDPSNRGAIRTSTISYWLISEKRLRLMALPRGLEPLFSP